MKGLIALLALFPLEKEHPLGPPHSLDELAKSTQPQSRRDAFGAEVFYNVERISDTPHMFLLQNFVSPTERYTLQWSARNDPKEAYSYTGRQASNRQGSFVSWLQPNAVHGISKALARSAASISFSHEMKQGKDGAGLFEQLQLVRYNTHGLFDLHHDSDKHGRVLTVLYYLNGVAGTWFPLASGITPHSTTTTTTTTTTTIESLSFLSKSPETEEISKDIIRDHNMQPGVNGILVAGGREYLDSSHSDGRESLSSSPPPSNEHVVRVNSGDALLFYNYKTSPNEQQQSFPGSIDWRGIHTALPATEPKCIATHWFHGGEILTGISNL